ncbi:hypothetical protein [Glutamicibacter ardleyensis]|uniref:hypothetical protein n=1 Tax=Glutamicibacter ardleyensis TaxID=225894 RepID=UPI003FD20A20
MLLQISPIPVTPIDQGATVWPVLLMMLGVAVALFIFPLALTWVSGVFDTGLYRRWAEIVAKFGLPLLVVASALTAIFLPYRVIAQAKTVGGMWSLFLCFAVFGVAFGFWVKRTIGYARFSLISAGAFIGLCFIMTVILSLSLLISTLVAQVSIIPLVLVVVFVMYLISKS